eukprot:Nk52_evm14s322 gene=Nk52_evmTU14s322
MPLFGRKKSTPKSASPPTPPPSSSLTSSSHEPTPTKETATAASVDRTHQTQPLLSINPSPMVPEIGSSSSSSNHTNGHSMTSLNSSFNEKIPSSSSYFSKSSENVSQQQHSRRLSNMSSCSSSNISLGKIDNSNSSVRPGRHRSTSSLPGSQPKRASLSTSKTKSRAKSTSSLFGTTASSSSSLSSSSTARSSRNSIRSNPQQKQQKTAIVKREGYTVIKPDPAKHASLKQKQMQMQHTCNGSGTHTHHQDGTGRLPSQHRYNKNCLGCSYHGHLGGRDLTEHEKIMELQRRKKQLEIDRKNKQREAKQRREKMEEAKLRQVEEKKSKLSQKMQRAQQRREELAVTSAGNNRSGNRTVSKEEMIKKNLEFFDKKFKDLESVDEELNNKQQSRTSSKSSSMSQQQIRVVNVNKQHSGVNAKRLSLESSTKRNNASNRDYLGRLDGFQHRRASSSAAGSMMGRVDEFGGPPITRSRSRGGSLGGEHLMMERKPIGHRPVSTSGSQETKEQIQSSEWTDHVCRVCDKQKNVEEFIYSEDVDVCASCVLRGAANTKPPPLVRPEDEAETTESKLNTDDSQLSCEKAAIERLVGLGLSREHLNVLLESNQGLVNPEELAVLLGDVSNNVEQVIALIENL